MIFVTVGSQLPFDRLVRAVETWAERAGRSDVSAQVGDGGHTPLAFACAERLGPEDFDARVAEAEVVVGHAGTGTIMAALMAGKPVVVLARREALGETRNDHQVATIERFAGRRGVFGTVDEGELPALIDAALAVARSGDELARLGAHASGPLVERLRGFLDTWVLKPGERSR